MKITVSLEEPKVKQNIAMFQAVREFRAHLKLYWSDNITTNPGSLTALLDLLEQDIHYSLGCRVEAIISEHKASLDSEKET